ncbi:MAG: hypothetical protein ACXVZX_03320 [Terriglobales bacterium]
MTRNSDSHGLDRAQFPHLSEFARGYLHEDLIPEHGSPLQATIAYLHDLTPAERKKIADEAFRFRATVKEMSSAGVNSAIARLGASWTFISKDELDQVLQTLERGH